jgi:hypothetical protein
MEGIVMKKMTHMISLSVNVDNPEKWRALWAKFSYTVQELEKDYGYVSLTSTLVEEDEEEQLVNRNTTMDLVRSSLKETGLHDAEIEAAVNSMQNQGLLFRERP